MRTLFLLSLIAGVLAAGGPARAYEARLEYLSLPPGFEIELYARVPGARSMAVTEDRIFVGTRDETVYAIGRRHGEVRPVLEDLEVPNGIAVAGGDLYVVTQTRVLRYPQADPRAEPQVVFDGLPDDPWHGWRYAAFGPDGGLYVSVGTPCNICMPEGLEGTIIRLDPEGGDPEVVARGIRNSVGLDFQPGSEELYFTDNGADYMGDFRPPDELNHAPRPGLHFGYPWYGGGQARTADFADTPLPAETQPPVVEFGAHVAALGIHFYRGDAFPPAWRSDAFVAQHGSWNKTVPDGYRVVRVRFDDTGHATGYETFIEGWLRDGEAWGRPVDIAELADGSLLISDDHLGAIYQVRYVGDGG